MSTIARPQIIPLRQGVNYAPLKPLLQLGDRKPQSDYLCDALKERYNHFWRHEHLVWREMISAGELVGHMMAGDQIERNPFTGGWLMVQPNRQDGSTQRALNFMQNYIIKCVEKWMQSNPDIIAKAARDDDRSTQAARAADIIVDHYELKFFQPWFNYAEALQALTFGTYLERFRHDAGIKGVVGIREIVENRTVQIGDGAGYCGDCGKYGAASDFAGPNANEGDTFGSDSKLGQSGFGGVGGISGIPRVDGSTGNICPQCGSDAVLIDQPPSDVIPSVIGQESVEMGDLVCESLLLPGCRWNLKTRAEWSSWFLYQQKVPMGAIRQILGTKNVPGEPEEIADIGQQVIKALAYSGQPVSGRAYQTWRNQKSNEPTLTEMWLSPEDYADILLKGDEETISGEKLPPGASLADLFPDGLCAIGLNGFAVTLGLYAEKHSDHITSGIWQMKPLSGAGRGQTDMVEVQKRFNKLDSQALAFMDAAATPAVLHDKNLLSSDEGTYLASPRAQIPVDLSQLPEGHRLSDVVLQMHPQSVPGQMVQYTQQFLSTAFAMTSMVTEFNNGGVLGQDNHTARAAMIADANANSIFGPLLAIKGETRKRFAEITTELYRNHFPLKRYFPLGGQYSQQPGMWLSAADLDADIRFEKINESELPQNSLTKQDRLMGFFEAVNAAFPGLGYAGALQAAPEVVTEMSRMWNVQVTTSNVDIAAQICRKRLEQMKAGMQSLAPMAGAQQMPMVDPMTGQPMPAIDPQAIIQFIQPPISMMEKDHQGKMNWFQVWLDTDEGQESPLELRAAAEGVIQIHYQFSGFQMGAMAAQAGQAQNIQGEASGENEMKRESLKNAQKNKPPQK